MLAYTLFGLGFGFVNAPITDTAVAGLPRDRAGMADAVAATSRQVGTAIGIAVVGAVVAAGSRAAARWIIAGCGLAVLALSAVTAGRRSPGGAGGGATDVDSEQSKPVSRTAG